MVRDHVRHEPDVVRGMAGVGDLGSLVGAQLPRRLPRRPRLDNGHLGQAWCNAPRTPSPRRREETERGNRKDCSYVLSFAFLGSLELVYAHSNLVVYGKFAVYIEGGIHQGL